MLRQQERSPAWHKRLRAKRAGARKRSKGSLRLHSNRTLIKDFVRLEAHHGSTASSKLRLELIRRGYMPQWTCGKCGMVHQHKEKGCICCKMGKQDAIAASRTSKNGSWEPVKPVPMQNGEKLLMRTSRDCGSATSFPWNHHHTGPSNEHAKIRKAHPTRLRQSRATAISPVQFA